MQSDFRKITLKLCYFERRDASNCNFVAECFPTKSGNSVARHRRCTPSNPRRKGNFIRHFGGMPRFRVIHAHDMRIWPNRGRPEAGRPRPARRSSFASAQEARTGADATTEECLADVILNARTGTGRAPSCRGRSSQGLAPPTATALCDRSPVPVVIVVLCRGDRSGRPGRQRAWRSAGSVSGVVWLSPMHSWRPRRPTLSLPLPGRIRSGPDRIPPVANCEVVSFHLPPCVFARRTSLAVACFPT